MCYIGIPRYSYFFPRRGRNLGKLILILYPKEEVTFSTHTHTHTHKVKCPFPLHSVENADYSTG